jgi:hypothetical protein
MIVLGIPSVLYPDWGSRRPTGAGQARSEWRRERGCVGPRVRLDHPPDERGRRVRHALGRATNPIADGLIAAGFAVSTGLGIVLVLLLGVWAGPGTPEEVRAVISFVLGAVSLSYAAGLLSGWVQAPVPDRAGTTPGPDSRSWLGRQLANLSPRRAALAGVLTHKPGLLYLAALSAITTSTSSNVNRILQVVLYNAIWFAMPMAALALARRRPVELQDSLRWTTEWVWHRQREIMITAFGILGAYLIVRGVVELRSPARG